MPIRPLDEKKCPVDISNVHSSIGRTEMSSGHSNVHWTYCSGIGHVWFNLNHLPSTCSFQFLTERFNISVALYVIRFRTQNCREIMRCEKQMRQKALSLQ